jgi:uncharacterized heparinase superfamily protein
MTRLAAPSALDRRPSLLPASASSWAATFSRLAARRLREEWFGSPPHLLAIARPRPEGQAAAPRDFRPADIERGRAVLAGAFSFDGLELQLGPGGEPWNRPAPSRAFAVQLHRMDWLRDVMAAGEAGPRGAVRLVQAWDAVFGRWNSFSWSPACLSRRTFNLACGLKRLSAQASADEADLLLQSLARQARHLLLLRDGPRWAAERAASAAVAGTVLAGRAGERLMARALERLEPALKDSVLADGGHASRAPEAGMELLLDLMTLDDALLQLGRPPPAELTRAIDRLAAALRFFTLADGRLASFQGGEQGERDRVIAAAASGEPDREAVGLAPPPSPSAPHAGYEKLIGRRLQVIVDAAPPARGPWSPTACAQPVALEVLGGPDRLITGAGWSVRAEAHQGLRLTPAASTLTLAEASAGAPISGLRARVLGPWLEGGPTAVKMRRHDAEAGAWLELSHDGWAPVFGLIHERRLFLDAVSDELRGEDRLRPPSEESAPGRRVAQFAVRFHIQPGVRAQVAEDQRSVLLVGASGQGWRLRTDAAEMTLEPSAHLRGGRPRRTSQIVLRSLIRSDRTGRVRWKIAAEGGGSPG